MKLTGFSDETSLDLAKQLSPSQLGEIHSPDRHGVPSSPASLDFKDYSFAYKPDVDLTPEERKVALFLTKLAKEDIARRLEELGAENAQYQSYFWKDGILKIKFEVSNYPQLKKARDFNSRINEVGLQSDFSLTASQKEGWFSVDPAMVLPDAQKQATLFTITRRRPSFCGYNKFKYPR